MRALYRITISTKCPVLEHQGRGRDIVDYIRGMAISTAKESNLFSSEEMRLANFKPEDRREAPTILYAHPVANVKSFDLYGRGEEGLAIIEKLADVILKKRDVRIGENEMVCTRRSVARIEPFIVSKREKAEHYYMATPAIFYDKNRDHGEWLAISKKFQESDPEKYQEEMKRSLSNLVKANVLYQMKYVVMRDMDSKAALKYLDAFSIEIERFHFKIDRYHRDQNKTPMVFMHFKSYFSMPRFIGHHSGRGYGCVNIDKRRKERK